MSTTTEFFQSQDFLEAKEKLEAAERLVVLTGAGMSAESGVPTFRDVYTGLWARFDPQQLATEEAFRARPDLVWTWYMWRAQLIRNVEPNAGHVAIGAAQKARGADTDQSQWLYVATQNVDDLHERAGTQVGAHLHGELVGFRCIDCAASAQIEIPAEPIQVEGDDSASLLPTQHCQHCSGLIRPGVVWFGEALPEQAFATTVERVQQADAILVVGSSGLVQPAASLPLLGLDTGAVVVEVNPAATELSRVADHHLAATAAVALPRLLG